MQPFSDAIGIFYRIIVIALALYGFHNLATVFLFFSRKRIGEIQTPATQPTEWLQVTVQLPIFNEKYTAERLLEAVTRLDYPQGKLQIQVLDDSTDDTADLVSRLVEEHQWAGVNIEYIHRDHRKGYKGGAMQEALKTATGELIGIFDADFLPDPSWLRQTVPFFQNPKLGCLQTRWGHTNRNLSLLTQAEALAIDGHFIVEQTVRSRNDLFLNFNGTAGLWRRACIEDAGGWQWDTMTEDLDLSYRAQMRGWKIDYRPDVVVPGELPADVESFKKQQSRWARGSFQVVRKILPGLLKRGDIPWYVRLVSALHMTGYLVHPLVLALLVLTLPVGLLNPNAFKALPLTGLACFGPPIMYLAAFASQKTPWLERLKMLPVLVVVGFGISLSTTLGVLEGLTGKKPGDWVVTPKLNLSDVNHPHKQVVHKEAKPVSKLVWAEIALAVYAFITIVVLTPVMGWAIVPWMTFYMLGFLYIASLNLVKQKPDLSRKKRKPKKVALQVSFVKKSKSYLKSIEELGGGPHVY